jgi:hypothetical protein
MSKPWKCCAAVAVALAVISNPARSQSPPENDSVLALFRGLAGAWSCAGGFARGGPLAADLLFEPALGGHVLRFGHVDRSPSTYWQQSTWMFDMKAKAIVSTGAVGSTKDYAGTPSLFVASAMSATSVTLAADTIKAPPFAPNRFTYTLRGPEQLEMRWEVQRDRSWQLGDSLVCHRA